MSQPDCDCGAELGGFHSFACARYASVEDNWTPREAPLLNRLSCSLQYQGTRCNLSWNHEGVHVGTVGRQVMTWEGDDTPSAVDDATGHSCGEVDDALPRLRALLADTKAMVVQAEAIVASMRDPANYLHRP
jgi:hypothetical protein